LEAPRAGSLSLALAEGFLLLEEDFLRRLGGAFSSPRGALRFGRSGGGADSRRGSDSGRRSDEGRRLRSPPPASVVSQ